MTENERAFEAVRAYQERRAAGGNRLPFAAIAAGSGINLSVRYGEGRSGLVSLPCDSADEVEFHLALLAGDPD